MKVGIILVQLVNYMQEKNIVLIISISINSFPLILLMLPKPCPDFTLQVNFIMKNSNFGKLINPI